MCNFLQIVTRTFSKWQSESVKRITTSYSVIPRLTTGNNDRYSEGHVRLLLGILIIPGPVLLQMTGLAWELGFKMKFSSIRKKWAQSFKIVVLSVQCSCFHVLWAFIWLCFCQTLALLSLLSRLDTCSWPADSAAVVKVCGKYECLNYLIKSWLSSIYKHCLANLSRTNSAVLNWNADNPLISRLEAPSNTAIISVDGGSQPSSIKNIYILVTHSHGASTCQWLNLT